MREFRNDAFSAYTSSNMKPRNITSDMWEPITTSGNYTAFASENRESAETKASASVKKTSFRAEEVNRTPADKNVQNKNGYSENKKKKSKPTENADKSVRNKKSSKDSAKPTTQKEHRFTERKQKKNEKNKPVKKDNKKIHKQRDKTNREFLKLINSGKSVDEARIIITKRKLRKTKISTLCSVFTLFIFAIVFIVSYTYCEGAVISNIIIEGDEVYTHDEILSAASLSEGMNMLTIREKTVNQSVTEALPFISVVNVEYDLPDTLRLNIISTRERLIIKNGSKYICLDKTGKVVSEKKKKLSEGQYLITGFAEQDYTVGQQFEPSEENKNKYEIACNVALAADANEIINTGTIDVSDVKDITLTYKSRLRVYLGSDNKLQSKLTIAEAVLIDNKAQNKTGYINAKYDVAAYFMQGSMQA